ncbi:MAG: DUF1189 family protein [Candidatus Aureabacteria bacterium]|nr:DUF1189 family protein [Candidatus Auribacterota bacterium]
MNNEIKNFFLCLKGSALSFDFYNKIIKQSLYRTLIYLSYLSILVAFFGGIFFFVYIQMDLKPFLKKVVQDVPAFTVENGKMTTASAETVIMNKRGLCLVIYPGDDKKEAEDILESLDGTNKVLLSNEAIITSNNYTISYFSWNDVLNFFNFLGINKLTDRFFTTLLSLSDFLPLLLFPVWIVLYFVRMITWVIYFTAFGFLFLKISETRTIEKKRDSLLYVFNISAYASTPGAILVILFLSLFYLFDLWLKPEQFLSMYIIVYIAFFIGAYLNLKKKYESGEKI